MIHHSVNYFKSNTFTICPLCSLYNQPKVIQDSTDYDDAQVFFVCVNHNFFCCFALCETKAE